MVITEAMLGNRAGDEQAARLEIEQAPAMALPASLRLAHYEPAHDFQSVEARSTVSDQAGTE